MAAWHKIPSSRGGQVRNLFRYAHFPQLAQQGKLLRMCALIRTQLIAELRLRTKK